MRQHIYSLIILVASLSTAHAQQTIYETVNVNGVNREYIVYLPVDFDPTETMPVLFAFHGGGGSPEKMMQYYGDFRPLANANRFIAVYPAALIDNTGCA